MDEFAKKLSLGGLIALFIFALAFGAFVVFEIIYDFKSLGTSYPARTISVSGEGKVVAIPDIGQFTFSILTQGGRDLAELQSENTKKANEIINFLKEKGIDSKDIATQSYNVEPRYQYFSCPKDGGACPPPEIVGYTVTQVVRVKVRDFSKIGNLFSGIVERGANLVSSLSFTVDDPNRLKNEARIKAIAQAKETAQNLARAGGFRLKRIFSITEDVPTPLARPYEDLGVGLAGSLKESPVSSAPTIEPGSQEITVKVNIVYEIE